MSKTLSPAEVDFWLDNDKYANYFEQADPTAQSLVFDIDMIRLASVRRAIANFVKILTRQAIPVYFHNLVDSLNIDGKSIYISAEIKNKYDFDVAVGLALHEGAHTLLTDFDVMKIAYANIPPRIFQLSDSKNIRRNTIESFIKGIINVVEDRYIDDYVFRNAPGYRGYYVSLYDRYFNDPQVDTFLQSDDYKFPSLKSYDFRIMNFTNPNTDLMALPRLDEIAEVFDLSNIKRLTTTRSRIETAFKVVEIVLECIDNDDYKVKIKSQPNSELADPSDYFQFEGEEENEEQSQENSKTKTPKSGKPKEKDVSKDIVKELLDIKDGKAEPTKIPENQDAVNKTKMNDDGINNKESDDLIKKQKTFLQGKIEKESLAPEQKELLDLIEKHGIILVQVPLVMPGDSNALKVDCIVVKNMTSDLITSGQEVFPLCGSMGIGGKPLPLENVADAVKKGILLGTKLGRKLQIRNEQTIDKIIRKKSGRINKRQLHEAAFDGEDLFYKINIKEHKRAVLHITVDASTSMMGKKWTNTMTSVVAICKAASMCENIHVTVSFRTTHEANSIMLPYIIMAYDSKVDKFSKVKNLFPYLAPNGCTPEGLAFGATMSLFEGITPDEEERFMLNLSDGEPFYSYTAPTTGLSVSYCDETGVAHTKSQVDIIRKKGVKILSYFIESPDDVNPFLFAMPNLPLKPNGKQMTRGEKLQRDFKIMYGKDAKFIDVNNIIDLATTINGLFINR